MTMDSPTPVRRKRRRWIAAAAVLALAGGSVIAGLAGRDNAEIPPRAEAVAGSEPVGSPHILRRSPRPDRAPCRLDRAEALEWIVQSAPWGAATGFALRTGSSERCTLFGTPQLVATNVATGVSEPVPTADLGPLEGNMVRQFPATVDPGEMARVHIRGNSACGPGQQPQSYRDLILVSDGRQLRVPEFRTLADVCGAAVSPWFVEPPMQYAAVNVSVQAPPVVRRGEEFTYLVRMDGALRRWHPVPSCPVYRVSLGALDAPWQRANCSAKAVSGKDAIRFMLRGNVPADAPVGQVKLTWMAAMDNGQAAIADMGTGGVTLTITS